MDGQPDRPGRHSSLSSCQLIVGRDEAAEDTPPTSFGRLLLARRRAAGLTQAELSRMSGISARALRDLEHGHARAAQQRPAEILADALGLAGEELNQFLTVAEHGRRRTTRAAAAAPCALPPALPVLFGRDDELARLRAEAGSGAGLAIVGPPGIGKTALAVWAAP